jgi:O-antigen/teichoic acid export membrane protein
MRLGVGTLRSGTRAVMARLPGGHFGRAVSVLAGGTAFAQLLIVLASPVVTRLYTPDEFGVYAVYGALVAIISVAAALGYEIAIPLPEEDSDAGNVFVLSLGVVLMIGLLATVVVATSGERLLDLANAELLSRYLWIIPVGLVGTGFYRVINYWAVRDREYSRIARTRLSQSIAHAGTQIVLGLLGLGPGGLIIGQVAGQMTGTGSLSRGLRSRWKTIRPDISLSAVLASARRYWKFPAFTGTGAFLNSGGLYVPAILFASLYSPQIAGWFALSNRIIGLPVALISRSVAQVYLGESTQKLQGSAEGMRRLFHRTAFRLSLLAVLPALAMLLLAPPVFAFAFGEPWRQAGIYVQLLVLMFVARFVVTSLTHTLNIIERQGRQFFWSAARLIMVVASIAIPAARGAPAWVAVLSYSAAMFVSYMALYGIMDFSLRRHRP